MEFNHVEGTQAEKPLAFDAVSSRTIVYVRKNIQQVTKENEDGTTIEMWEYDEAEVPADLFNAVASEIINTLSDQSELTMANVEYIAMMSDIDIDG